MAQCNFEIDEQVDRLVKQYMIESSVDKKRALNELIGKGWEYAHLDIVASPLMPAIRCAVAPLMEALLEGFGRTVEERVDLLEHRAEDLRVLCVMSLIAQGAFDDEGTADALCRQAVDIVERGYES